MQGLEVEQSEKLGRRPTNSGTRHSLCPGPYNTCLQNRETVIATQPTTVSLTVAGGDFHARARSWAIRWIGSTKNKGHTSLVLSIPMTEPARDLNISSCEIVEKIIASGDAVICRHLVRWGNTFADKNRRYLTCNQHDGCRLLQPWIFSWRFDRW